MKLQKWCAKCQQYVSTSQISDRYVKIDGSAIRIIEHYCTICCTLIHTEEKPIIGEQDV